MLPSDAISRKGIPIYSGFLMYFPDAVAEVARLSQIANEQHNPGEPVHWSRGKSADHEDCLMRHMMQLGEVDSDGVLHDAKVAWRAMAVLQLRLESMQKESGQE